MAQAPHVQLKLLPRGEYVGVNQADPIRFYAWPIVGPLYRRRVEMCLEQCPGGQRVLEIGFGSGVTFLNLSSNYDEIHGLDLTADVATVTSTFARHGVHPKLLNGSVLQMPYADASFDTVLLISILEHLQPSEQHRAFTEMARVLKPGGRVVYGVPIERRLMVLAFRMLGYDIRKHHFSTENDVAAGAAATGMLSLVQRISLCPAARFLGAVYQVGVFQRA